LRALWTRGQNDHVFSHAGKVERNFVACPETELRSKSLSRQSFVPICDRLPSHIKNRERVSNEAGPNR
jgi:hypothetical protein